LTIFFNQGRSICGESSFKTFDVLYDKKNFYTFLTEKKFTKFKKYVMAINSSKRVKIFPKCYYEWKMLMIGEHF